MGTWGLVGGSRAVLAIPKDLAPSSDSPWLPHQSMYCSQCLLHLLASSQLPGRWLLCPLCAMPTLHLDHLPSCCAGLSGPGPPRPKPVPQSPLHQPPSVPQLPQTCSSSTWEVTSLSGQSPRPLLHLPRPHLLSSHPLQPHNYQVFPPQQGSHACLFLAISHPCRHLESSSHSLLGIAGPSGLLLPKSPQQAF